MNADSIGKIIDLDNCPEMKNSFVEDYHVWYGMRSRILNLILSKYLKQDNPKIILRLRDIGIRNIITYLYLTIIKYPYFSGNKKMIFFSSNVVNMKEDKYYTNRLYDFFFSQYKEISLLIEDSYFRCYRIPRKETVFYIDLIYLAAAVLRRFIRLRNDTVKNLKEKFYAIKNRFGNELENKIWDELYITLLKQYKRFLIEKKIYLLFLKKVHPKIVFREDASYGGHQALSNVCNRLNIIYAEFQHGLVSSNSIEYNYGESFFKYDKLKKLLPEYYLTFGKYWSDKIRIPGKKIEIGFPYLREKALRMQKNRINQDAINILIVSNGNLPEVFQQLTEKLAHSTILNKPCSICFKLHPVEVPLLKERYPRLPMMKNVDIKTYEPIYSLFLDADVVVGCSSTAMFEAVQFQHRPYIYLNNSSIAYIDDFSFFETFKDYDELLEKIKQNNCNNETNERLNYLWEQHSKECFDKFINSILV